MTGLHLRVGQDARVQTGGAVQEFPDFYAANFGRVVAAVRVVADSAAEDVAQEAFIVAHHRWDEVSGLDVPYAWVRRVAFRIAGRRAARDRLRPELERMIGASDMSLALDLDVDVVAGLECMPAREATALWLYHLEDRSIVEVAERLGCSVGATKVFLMRSRRRLAERVGGVNGRWISERTWSPDSIVGHVGPRPTMEYAEVILDDLGGRGGRWELTVAANRYTLMRDDGLRLDHGRCSTSRRHVELVPELAEGHVLFRWNVDGDQLRMVMIENTTPPTRGVPDAVWMNLYVESGPFRFSGQPQMSV